MRYLRRVHPWYRHRYWRRAHRPPPPTTCAPDRPVRQRLEVWIRGLRPSRLRTSPAIRAGQAPRVAELAACQARQRPRQTRPDSRSPLRPTRVDRHATPRAARVILDAWSSQSALGTRCAESETATPAARARARLLPAHDAPTEMSPGPHPQHPRAGQDDAMRIAGVRHRVLDRGQRYERPLQSETTVEGVRRLPCHKCRGQNGENLTQLLRPNTRNLRVSARQASIHAVSMGCRSGRAMKATSHTRPVIATRVSALYHLHYLRTRGEKCLSAL